VCSSDLSGIIAALVSFGLQMSGYAIAGSNIWMPARLLAGLTMGATPTMFFGLGAWMIAWSLILACALGVAYTVMLSQFIRAPQRPAVSVLIGMALGLVLYGINFYALASVFPAVTHFQNLIMGICHVIFGGVAAALYKTFESPTIMIFRFRKHGRRTVETVKI
jgi:hypothetical protein